METLAREVLALLKEKGVTLSTAESCTGGLIASTITDLPGSSAVFAGGVVSYWTQVKEEVLGVDGQVLAEVGAVAAETARQMAQGARQLLKTDLAVSVTGVAGPDSDERGNPVGLVYLALADGESTLVCAPENLGTTRREIRENAVKGALAMVKEKLDNS